jgi:hypothetical protein
MSLIGWSGSAKNVRAAAASGFPRGRSVLYAARAVALAVALTVAPAAAQFSAQPVIIEMRAADGAAGAVITVRNESTAPLQLQVYGGDFDQPQDGGHVFMGLGEHERSCASRLEIEPAHLTLEPRGSGEVRVRMEPGSETCWSLVFLEGLVRGGAGIHVTQRIGVKVYGVGPSSRTDGEVSHVRIDTAADGSRHIDVAFANTGTAPVRAEGELEIRSESGAVVITLPIPPFSVLPGRTIRTRVSWAVELPVGVYLLIPILDFGGDYLAAGQALLEIEGS